MLEPATARGRRTTYILFWALAATCFGLAVTETTVFGLGQMSLLVMATVFAAVTDKYRGESSCTAEAST